MKRGSLRELLKKPNWDFATATLALGLLPASVIGVLKYNDITKPWSAVQFSVVTAYRTIDSAYEEDLSARLNAVSLEHIKTTIENAPLDAMLPGGLVYLADDGLRLQRIDTTKAKALREENRHFAQRLEDVCTQTPAHNAATSCDPLAVYDLIRSEFDAQARARMQKTVLPYTTLTGEHPHPLRPTQDATPTRELLLLAQRAQRSVVEEIQLRGAQSRVDELARQFTTVQPHEQQYLDELRAYAQRPEDVSLYGTWEYRGAQPIDWAGAHDAGQRKPHLVILADTRGMLIWQFYKGAERSFYVAPDRGVNKSTVR